MKGEKEKALSIYTELAGNDANIPLIHNNYINLMLDLGRYDEAVRYLRRLQRQQPENIEYELDMGLVYMRSGDTQKADRVFGDVIARCKTSVNKIKIVSDYFTDKRLIDYAIVALQESRKALGNRYMFGLELAMLYRMQGKKEQMVEEYLSYVTQNSGNLQYVKNVMQALLTKPDELQTLEKILYQKVQQSPGEEVFSDLLIWVTMQQRNFNASFIQARAYDKRNRKQGEKCMEVARVAADNREFETASKIYKYVADEFPSGPFYLQARLGLISTREAKIRASYPVSSDSVVALTGDYERFVRDYPSMQQALEATRSQALLYANYLDELDTAIKLLDQLVSNPRITLYMMSRVKLDLGDIYVLKGEPWEAVLLYAQVEKTQKDNPVGYDAKLKSARLSYFQGDFQLAQEHLDILKEATTREIANDAMELSMRIKENIAYDSMGLALRQYSRIELLQMRHRTARALQEIARLKEGRARIPLQEAEKQGLKFSSVEDDSVWITFSNHAILDDAYWLEAKIRLEQGEFQASLQLLQKILDDYGDDILADDALFKQGEIYEVQLRDKEKAMEVYRKVLERFPGSVYTAEARKRYRILRGDFPAVDPVLN